MAEVTNHLIYEVLKQVQERVNSVDLRVGELKSEMQASRGHIIAMQQDVHKIYATLARQDLRLDRMAPRPG